MPIPLQSILDSLEMIAPLAIAESWDNVGLLAGSPEMQIRSVMTCLTIAKETVIEAINRKIDLVVVHHPLPFKPINRLSTQSTTGRWLWKLASAKIAIYSPHTAWDNTIGGINDQIANILQLDDVESIVPFEKHVVKKLAAAKLSNTAVLDYPCPTIDIEKIGSGRIGSSRTAISSPQGRTIGSVVEMLQAKISSLIISSNAAANTPVSRIAVVCGSGGSFAESAYKAGADLLVTGEATYHQMLEAQSLGLNLLTIGHYASERFAMENLANRLKSLHENCEFFASTEERDSICNWEST